MRICLLVPDRTIAVDGPEGAAAHIRGIASAFARLGHDVVLVSHGLAANGAATGAGWKNLRIQVRELAAPPMLSGLEPETEPGLLHALAELWSNGPMEATLEEIVASTAPDLLYERCGPFSIAGGIVARRHGVPHVLEVNAPLTRARSIDRRRTMPEVAELLGTAALRNAQRIIAVSGQLRDLLIAAGADGGKVSVVPNGVDTELFHTRPRPRAGKKGPITIAYAGSVHPWHGLDQLCDAFRLLSSDARFRLMVLGDGPAADLVRQLADEFPGRVASPGAVPHDRIPDYLRQADIAVAPYPAIPDFYFSPLKILEYMALGLPVVASRIGQVPELIRDNHTGVLVQPGDAVELASVLRQLADEPARREAIGAAAARHVAAKHSWMHRAEVILQDLAVAA